MTSPNTSSPCDTTPGGIVKIGQPLYDVPRIWMSGDAAPETFEAKGATVQVWSDADATWCFARGIIPQNLRASREAQTQNCFDQMESILRKRKMRFTDVARTWFFNDRILEWYGEFNKVRTTFFNKRKLPVMPASTGVGMPNPVGAELTAAMLAIVPHRKRVALREVFSPEQCPAVDYKSSFSRAMSLDTPERKVIWISGTASIAPCGKTEFVGDVDKQIERTLDVVEAILHAEKMTWSDVNRAVAYFKNMNDIKRFAVCARGRELPKFPTALVHAYVCRDDLLFELEADALKAR